MKLNKSFDRITQALSVAIKESEDYNSPEIKELLSLILNFYLQDEESKFHKFFLEVVHQYKKYGDF